MYVAAVLLAVVVVLCACYYFGAPISYNWSYERIPCMPFRTLEPEVLQLKAVGSLEAAETLLSEWPGEAVSIRREEARLHLALAPRAESWSGPEDGPDPGVREAR